MTEIIEARIFIPLVEPYSEKELDNLPSRIAQSMRRENFKVTGEEQLAIETDNREELRYRVLDLCFRHRPHPLLVKLNNTTLNRTFIVNELSDVINDHEATLENIHFTYNEKGKEIQKFIQQGMQEYDEQWHKIISESGIDQREIWSILTSLDIRSKVPRDLFEYRTNILDQDKQSVVKRILDVRKNILKKTCSEISEKFGINKKFTYDYPRPDLHPNPYSTIARRNEEEQLLDVTTVLYDFIEERGRMISRGRRFSVFDTWFKKWHPELVQPGVMVTDNSTYFDGPYWYFDKPDST